MSTLISGNFYDIYRYKCLHKLVSTIFFLKILAIRLRQNIGCKLKSNFMTCSHDTHKIFKFILSFSLLTRTNSGSSVESFTTPLKLVKKDTSTGEYIVKMSPQDFDRLSNQGHVIPTQERYISL